MSIRVSIASSSGGFTLAILNGGVSNKTGKPWTVQEMVEAIQNRSHASAMDLEAMAQLTAEVEKKVKNGQSKLVL